MPYGALETIQADITSPPAGSFIFDPDPMLAAGSLFLFDGQNLTANLSAVPALSGGSLPNSAASTAAGLTAGAATAMNGVLTTGSAPASTAAKFEITTKKGLHGIYSQTNDASSDGVYVDMPAGIKQYLITNAAHTFRFSMMGYMTRAAITSVNPRISNICNTASPADYMEYMDNSGNAANGSLGSVDTGGPNSVGAFYRSVVFSGFNSAAPTSTANLIAALAAWGPYGAGYSVWANKSASFIVYRLCLEDITASLAADATRTVAAAETLDSGLFTSYLQTSGGRFYGDNFTAPSALP